MSAFNLVSRILDRQLSDGPTGSKIAKQRRIYENIVPNDQAKQAEPPDCHICKFLPSGSLVCFGNMQHEIVVYNYKGPGQGARGEVAGMPYEDGLPFSRFFRLKFRRIVTHGNEILCRDLCLVAFQERFLIIASCTAPTAPPPSPTPDRNALQGIPLVASTTFHVVSAENGEVFGEYVILDDFIHLSHANGVYLQDDRLCILAIRSQTIHILHITQDGQLLLSQRLGTHCQDDDELAIARYEDAESAWHDLHTEDQMAATQDRVHSHHNAGVIPASQDAASLESLSQQLISLPRGRALPGFQRAASAPLPNESPWAHIVEIAGQHRRHAGQLPGLASPPGPGPGQREAATASPASQSPSDPGLITGIKQRIMAYIYLHSCKSNNSSESRRRFFYHFEDYSNLAMWKVQMLDRDNLLISMGPPDVSINRDMGNTASHSYCLLVWSLTQARVVDLHDVGSKALLHLYQTHWHLFHAGCIISPWHQFLSPPGGCRAPLSPFTPQSAVRRVLTNLPASSQLMSPSPYLDLNLFQYDERHMSAMVRPRLFHEQPLKFFARHRPDKARFKIQAASGEGSSRFGRNFVAHHFHPFLPLVLCVVQSYMDPPQLTIFLRSQ